MVDFGGDHFVGLVPAADSAGHVEAGNFDRPGCVRNNQGGLEASEVHVQHRADVAVDVDDESFAAVGHVAGCAGFDRCGEELAVSDVVCFRVHVCCPLHDYIIANPGDKSTGKTHGGDFFLDWCGVDMFEKRTKSLPEIFGRLTFQ